MRKVKIGQSTIKNWHVTTRGNFTRFHKTKGAYTDVHGTNFCRGYFSNKEEANCKDRTVYV